MIERPIHNQKVGVSKPQLVHINNKRIIHFPYKFSWDFHKIPLHCGVEKWYLVSLISWRSKVRIFLTATKWRTGGFYSKYKFKPNVNLPNKNQQNSSKLFEIKITKCQMVLVWLLYSLRTKTWVVVVKSAVIEWFSCNERVKTATIGLRHLNFIFYKRSLKIQRENWKCLQKFGGSNPSSCQWQN